MDRQKGDYSQAFWWTDRKVIIVKVISIITPHTFFFFFFFEGERGQGVGGETKKSDTQSRVPVHVCRTHTERNPCRMSGWPPPVSAVAHSASVQLSQQNWALENRSVCSVVHIITVSVEAPLRLWQCLFVSKWVGALNPVNHSKEDDFTTELSKQ